MYKWRFRDYQFGEDEDHAIEAHLADWLREGKVHVHRADQQRHIDGHMLLGREVDSYNWQCLLQHLVYMHGKSDNHMRNSGDWSDVRFRRKFICPGGVDLSKADWDPVPPVPHRKKSRSISSKKHDAKIFMERDVRNVLFNPLQKMFEPSPAGSHICFGKFGFFNIWLLVFCLKFLPFQMSMML